MTDIDPGRLQSLKAIFEKTDASGARVYSDDAIFHFIPYVLLADGAVDPSDLSDEVAALLGSFVTVLGIKKTATPKEVGDALRAYYGLHPVNADLLAEFARFAGATGEADASAMKKAAQLLGQAGSAIPVGARTGDGARAGPLSRFTLKVPDKDQER